MIVRVLHLLDPQPAERVLDVGTGSGYSAALLSHRLGDDQVTSVDVTPISWRRRENAWPHLVGRQRLRLVTRQVLCLVASTTGSSRRCPCDRSPAAGWNLCARAVGLSPPSQALRCSSAQRCRTTASRADESRRIPPAS
ncbi:hypothetical protein G3I17_00285 [Streptomyces sp. SID13031]|nr:hypothetical protein [Streptomyces sp. SID13031]